MKPVVEKLSKLFTEVRSEEHTSELQSPLIISYAVFCLKGWCKLELNLQQCEMREGMLGIIKNSKIIADEINHRQMMYLGNVYIPYSLSIHGFCALATNVGLFLSLIHISTSIPEIIS